MIRRSLAALALGGALIAPPAWADFRGGGALFNFTESCRQQSWPVGGMLEVRVRHAPSELAGLPSQITIAFPTGTQHYAVWQTLAASSTNFNGLGRRVWTDFILHPNRPRIRPVARRITALVNAGLPESVQNAREMFLRVRIENFNDLPGCAVTLATQLRRF